ncbi:MAG: DUF1996 domain-containing protein [Sphingomonadales bacterium]|nr:DUF1996 domain-containing protein [Sphingomonadales bacterium]
MTVQLPDVPSNFDVNSELVKAWGTGAIPASALPDVVGAFRFICNASHLSYDDPIVYPGQPGKSHLHQYFGNTSADANSTFTSLRTTGSSTCNSPLNRSAYWMPAMMNGKGQVIKPDYVSVYYKRRPKTDPLCAKIGTACVDLPRGLRFVFGYNMLNTTAKPTGGGYFNCQGTGAVSGHYKDLPTAQANCPATAQLGAVISAPECWDGKNLDSADHRSHVAYSAYIGQSYPMPDNPSLRHPDLHDGRLVQSGNRCRALAPVVRRHGQWHDDASRHILPCRLVRRMGQFRHEHVGQQLREPAPQLLGWRPGQWQATQNVLRLLMDR